MGKYTTEVRYICETNVSESVSGNGFNNVDDIIFKSRANIFNFNYPIFDETYRPVLESKILRHYYTREISEETVGLWKLRLCDKLNLIMPYYNQLYQSELLSFNPLYDIDITTTHGGTKEGSKTDNTDITDNRNTSEGIFNTESINNNETISNTENTQDMGTESANRDNNTNEQRENAGVSTTTNNISDSGTASSSTASGEGIKSSENNNHLDKYLDTPQGRVSNLTDGFLTNVRDITESKSTDTETASTSTGISNSNSTKTENGISNESATGKSNRNETDNFNSTKMYSQNKDTSENRDREENRNKIENRIKNDSKTSDKNSTSTMTNIEQYIEHINGKRGTVSYSKLLTEFRETFLNIDAMIIEELNDLFFGLW